MNPYISFEVILICQNVILWDDPYDPDPGMDHAEHNVELSSWCNVYKAHFKQW